MAKRKSGTIVAALKRGRNQVARSNHGTGAGTRLIGNELVRVEQVYRVPELQPRHEGRWRSEADKIAWIDPATGLSCIIRRSSFGGSLCGFVAVGPEHGMYGRRHDAIPEAASIRVHGGLDYSEMCDEDGNEERSVCHVRVGEIHDAKWWFGFSCDHSYDVVPDLNRGLDPALAAEPVYRDERYVFEQCTGLAAQLQAIAEGDSPLGVELPFAPPIGLDPDRACK